MAAADTALAAQWELSASVIEGMRRTKLTEGAHWSRKEGQRIAYTPEGIELLRSLLDLPEIAKKEEGAVVSLRIMRLYPNPSGVMVQLPDGGFANVRVKSNRKLKLRSALACRPLPDGRWECCHPGLGLALPKIEKGEVPATQSPPP